MLIHCFKINFNYLQRWELKYVSNFQIKNTILQEENDGLHASSFKYFESVRQADIFLTLAWQSFN